MWLFFPQLHVVYAQSTNVWSLNYLCGYWSVVYLLNCCVVTELTKRKTKKMKGKCVWCFFRCGDITPQHFDVWRLSLDFSQRGLSLWFLDNLYYYIFFVFLFLLKTDRKRMMTIFWSGEKARKKSLETKSQKVPKIQNNHFKYIVTRTKNTISWIQIKEIYLFYWEFF